MMFFNFGKVLEFLDFLVFLKFELCGVSREIIRKVDFVFKSILSKDSAKINLFPVFNKI